MNTETTEATKECASFFICPFATKSLLAYLESREVPEERRLAALAWLNDIQKDVEEVFRMLSSGVKASHVG